MHAYWEPEKQGDGAGHVEDVYWEPEQPHMRARSTEDEARHAPGQRARSRDR